MNMDAKLFNARENIQWHIEDIIYYDYDHDQVSNWDLSLNARMAQHVEINETHHINRMNWKKTQSAQLIQKKHIWWNSTSIHDQNPQHNGYGRNLL
jgi:histone acetyltransferase (RNA polymerase elongator complex component)